MRIFFAIALILALLATVFAVQNIKDVTISFLLWSIEGSLALVLMVTLVLGITIGVLLMAPGSVRYRLQVGGLQRTVRSMEDEKEASAAPATQPEATHLEARQGGSPEDK
ncbi:MAG: lipopolysaccharide assembly LapA domain-containing protein [Anaerolineales bacterium]